MVLGLSGEDTVSFWEAELDTPTAPAACSRRWPCTCGSASCSGSCGDLRAALQSLVPRHRAEPGWSVQSVGQMYVEPFAVHVAPRPRELEDARRCSTWPANAAHRGQRAAVPRGRGAAAARGGPAEEALAVLDAAEPLMAVVENPVWRPRRGCVRGPCTRSGATRRRSRWSRRSSCWPRSGAPRAWSAAPAAARARSEGPDGEATLRDAVDLLERSARRLDARPAHGCTSAGPARARARRRGLRAVPCCRAPSRRPSERRRRGLWPGRPRRCATWGVDIPEERRPSVRLTTTERRIAAMAAEGSTSTRSRRRCFITTGTVTVDRRLGLCSASASALLALEESLSLTPSAARL